MTKYTKYKLYYIDKWKWGEAGGREGKGREGKELI
jgi:hypothetical protein